MDGSARGARRLPVRDDLLPVLRLFRSALGRDPVGGELRPLLEAQRHGAALLGSAHGLLSTAEGRAFHAGPGGSGPDGPADDAFVLRAIQAAAGGAAKAGLSLAVALTGPDRSEALATLAATPLFQDDPPALPAMFGDRRPDDPEAYAYWQRWLAPTDPPAAQTRLPVGLAMAVGDTTAERAVRTLQSLQEQSHADWRLAITGTLRSPWAQAAVASMAADPRVLLLPPVDGFPPALRDAMRAVGGAALATLEAGATLAEHALAHLVAVLEADPAASLVFSDEDVLGADEGCDRPRFKTVPDAAAMLAGDAIGQLALYRTALFERPEINPGAAGYDLALQAFRAEPGGVRHVPRVLYHASTARLDWPAAVTGPRKAGGLVATAGVKRAGSSVVWPRVRAPDATGALVTVIVLTRDRPDLLRTVTDGVLHRTDHARLELLLVDHASTEPEAVALLSALGQDERVRVLPYAGAFNFASMNNRAAAEARGEILLLLNNDVEILHPEWLSEVASHAMRPEVGLAGARLLHRDGTLQHGGIALGPAGRATHLFRGAARDDPGYLGLLAITRDVAAVTGACIAIRRAVYQAVGGMDEAFPTTWNDIDLCQRVRRAGLRVVWTPHAVLTHLEGETRGRDSDPSRHAAFLADGARYRALWGEAADTDPCVNPNLVATDTELCLASPRLGGR